MLSAFARSPFLIHISNSPPRSDRDVTAFYHVATAHFFSRCCLARRPLTTKVESEFSEKINYGFAGSPSRNLGQQSMT
jgi:hypothetical protein